MLMKQMKCYGMLASVHYREKVYSLAVTGFEKALSISRRVQDKENEARCLQDLASVSMQLYN